jgi:hypothetical protein
VTERPDEQDGPTEGPANDDAVWRSIIDNYGDRPEIKDPAEPVAPIIPASVSQEQAADIADDWDDPEDHFTPPPPPVPQHATGARLAAWVGIFGVPAVMLVCLLAGWTVPSPVGLLFLCWFVGGFVYLVATMRKDPPDDWYDDGAVI